MDDNDNQNNLDAKPAAESSTAATSQEKAPAQERPSLLDVALKAAEQSQARVKGEVLGEENADTEQDGESSVQNLDRTEEATEVEAEGQDGQEAETPAEDQPTEGEEKPEGEVETETEEEEQQEAEEETEKEAGDEEKPDAANEDKKLPPFHKHPAYTRQVERAKKAETDLARLNKYAKETLDPLARQQDYHQKFCAQNGIEAKEVDILMSALAHRYSDPGKARAMVDQLLSTFIPTPGSIDPDLRQKVTDGHMSKEDAIEMTNLRAQQKVGQRRVKLTEQQKANLQQSSVNAAIENWQVAKEAKDPSFKPGSDLYEVMADRFSALQLANPPGQNAAVVIKNLEDAYSWSVKLFTKRAPLAAKPVPNKKPLNTSNSNGNGRPSKQEPKGTKAVVASVLAKHRVQVVG